MTLITSYVLVQQATRLSINVPLIQMAQSAEAALKSGVTVSAVLKAQQIDLSINQSPFITLYSPNGVIIGSSQHLGSSTLRLPDGVLANARKHGQVRLTWQPTRDLRFASVTDYVPQLGFVSTAQSLKESEARTIRAQWITLMALFLGSLVSGFFLWYLAHLKRSAAL